MLTDVLDERCPFFDFLGPLQYTRGRKDGSRLLCKSPCSNRRYATWK